MPGRHRDPNIGPEEQHPGAPREEEERQDQDQEREGQRGGEKRRIGEDRTPGDRKPMKPVGNSQLPDEPAVFPPHN